MRSQVGIKPFRTPRSRFDPRTDGIVQHRNFKRLRVNVAETVLVVTVHRERGRRSQRCERLRRERILHVGIRRDKHRDDFVESEIEPDRRESEFRVSRKPATREPPVAIARKILEMQFLRRGVHIVGFRRVYLFLDLIGPIGKQELSRDIYLLVEPVVERNQDIALAFFVNAQVRRNLVYKRLQRTQVHPVEGDGNPPVLAPKPLYGKARGEPEGVPAVESGKRERNFHLVHEVERQFGVGVGPQRIRTEATRSDIERRFYVSIDKHVAIAKHVERNRIARRELRKVVGEVPRSDDSRIGGAPVRLHRIVRLGREAIVCGLELEPRHRTLAVRRIVDIALSEGCHVRKFRFERREAGLNPAVAGRIRNRMRTHDNPRLRPEIFEHAFPDDTLPCGSAVFASKRGGNGNDGKFVRRIFRRECKIRAHVTGDATVRIAAIENRKARHNVVVGMPDDAVAAENRKRNVVAFLVTQDRFLQAQYSKSRFNGRRIRLKHLQAAMQHSRRIHMHGKTLAQARDALFRNGNGEALVSRGGIVRTEYGKGIHIGIEKNALDIVGSNSLGPQSADIGTPRRTDYGIDGDGIRLDCIEDAQMEPRRILAATQIKDRLERL